MRGTAADSTGILRIWFPDVGAGSEELDEISWDRFFEKFETESLTFLYQDETADGDVSRFFKFIDRDGD